jgi:hypothetical protein
MTTVEKILLGICVLWLLSSLLHNNKEEAFKENLTIVFFIIVCYLVFLGLGWFYSLGDK